MTHSQSQSALFYERGFNFEDILTGDALGGPKAIEAYLGTRRNMCVRAIIAAASEGTDTRDLALLQHGLRAFDQSQAILPKLKRKVTSKALLMALGPRHLLGLK